MNIVYIDRKTGRKEVEKVYKNEALRFLYGDHWLSQHMSSAILPMIAKLPFFSQFYGFLQKQTPSAKKIRPFIKHFEVNEEEFLDSTDSFTCFNDFFIRKLKPEARPLAFGAHTAIMPADGRYYFYPDISQTNGFIVKGKKFCLEELLQSKKLAETYAEGSMVLARLCPSDYHRFHFPCDGTPGPTQLINGYLYSVNPMAIRKNLDIFTQNKRTVCEIDTSSFGKVLYLEIGATCVGSIHETYTPGIFQEKGAEKGYFEFGGSSLILLFPKNKILFDEDLVAATKQGFEIRCLFGQKLGTAINQ
jgi:phosphatidylserine decarboxylase